MLVCFMLLLLSVGHGHPEVNCVVTGLINALIMQEVILPPTFIPLAKDIVCSSTYFELSLLCECEEKLLKSKQVHASTLTESR